MAGIKTVQEILKAEGRSTLKNILQKKIKISEKFDAYRFSFEKDLNNNNLYYYGKNAKVPLNVIDRSLSDLYENAISYINNIPPDIFKSIPSGHRFSFYFFPKNKYIAESYDYLPENNLLLTDVTIRNKKNNTVRNITDQNVLRRWSDIFKVKYYDSVFEGELNESCVDCILNIAENKSDLTNLSALLSINSIFKNDKLPNTIIIESEDQLIKISQTENTIVSEKRSHMFDILLLDIFNHVDKSIIKIYSLHTTNESADQAYLNVVCELFNNYVTDKGNDYLQSGFKKPEYIEKVGNFNTKWIKDKKTLSIISENSEYEYLLSIFIANLRKPKTSNGLLTESVVSKFNNNLEMIDKLIGDDFSFLEFNTIYNDYSEIKESEEVDTKDTEVDTLDYEKGVKILSAFFTETKKSNAGKEKINLIICNGGFLTNTILEEAKKLKLENDKKSIIISIRKELGLTQEHTEKILKVFIEENKDYFIECFCFNRLIVETLLKNVRKHWEPTNISYIDGDVEELQMLLSGFSIISLDEDRSIKKINCKSVKDTCLISAKEHLENKSFESFCKVVPQCLHYYWTELQTSFDKNIYI